MKKFTCLLATLFFFICLINAQIVAINEDGSVPHPKAILDLKSTSKGLLIPRLTRDEFLPMTYGGAIIPEGLLIYRTGFDPGFHYYQGNYWQQLTPFTHTLSQSLNPNGYEISGGGGYIQIANNNINTRDL